jgi:uncharacterized protein YkwD
VFHPRPHKIAALALTAFSIAVPAASAHSHKLPHHVARIGTAAMKSDPVAHIATTSDPVAHIATASDPVAHIATTSDPVARIATNGARSCANANTAATHATKSAMRAAVVCLINKQRTERGLPALHEQAQLQRSAQAWTSTMVDQNNFSHGTAFWNRIQATGYDWQTLGENIATGFTTPAEVVTAWMGSPGHCRNILNPNYVSVGTGVLAQPVLSGANGGATWTQDFGRTMSQNAPSTNWAPANAACR